MDQEDSALPVTLQQRQREAYWGAMVELEMNLFQALREIRTMKLAVDNTRIDFANEESALPVDTKLITEAIQQLQDLMDSSPASS